MAIVDNIENYQSCSVLHNEFTVNEIKSSQKKIPVVHYQLFKDDDKESRIPVDFEKIIRLLSQPHSSTLYDRHALAMKKLFKRSQNGFMMKDSLNVSKLLSLCVDRSAILPKIYLQPIIDILKICSKPFLKEKSSDKVLYTKIYSDLISQMGYTLRMDNLDIRLQVCKSLFDLYNEGPLTEKINDIVPNDIKYTKSIIEQSDVSEILIQSLSIIGDNLELKLAILNLLEIMTKKSVDCCNKILSVNSLSHLYKPFGNFDASKNILFRLVNLLWNLLEHGNASMLTEQLSTIDCICWLRDCFIDQLSKSYSSYDRQLRNDILVLATQLATLNPNAPFVETGFVKQLTLLATFQEVKSHNPLVKNLKMALNHEDFELKKLLINILVILSDNRSVIPIMEEGQFMLALFTNINPLPNLNSGTRKSSESKPSKFTHGMSSVWKPAYQEELQLYSLSALTTLVPKMLHKFQDLCGVNRLLMLVEWCINDDLVFFGNGNSFHGAGGRGNKLAQMRYCMRLILRIVRANDEIINQEFVDEGCISLFIEILSNVIKSQDTNASIDLEIQCDMLFILAALCERDPHRKELFGQDGVRVAIGFLKNCLRLSTKNTEYESNNVASNPAEVNGWQKLIIAVIDTIWACIIGCYVTEHMFLDQNGAFMILDMLEVLPAELYPQILGCLVDLSENAKALNHLSTWRGSILQEKDQHLITNKDTQVQSNVAHLLCRIWREEEIRIDVARGEYSTLLDINNPLMGLDQKAAATIPNLEADQPTRSILEVSESLRANIYSLLSRLGYLDHPGLKIDDHVTLTIIESYLEFKMGEVWTEIQKELTNEDIRPISPDVEALEWISRCIEQEGVRVSKIQEELVEAMKAQNISEEFEFYNQLRENHRQKEKNIQHFQEFVERTSNYEKLKFAKCNQMANIEASRITIKNPDKSTVFHKTDIDNINVTKFCAESIQINSTPLHILGEIHGMDQRSTPNGTKSPLDQGSSKKVILSSLAPTNIN